MIDVAIVVFGLLLIVTIAVFVTFWNAPIINDDDSKNNEDEYNEL